MATPATLPEWIAENAPPSLAPTLLQCFASRGKRKGLLLASVPTKKGPAVVGAWRSLMATVAPMRAGLFSFGFWADPPERMFFDATETWLAWNNKTAETVVYLAAGRQFEFHTGHHRLQGAPARAFAKLVGITPKALGL